MADIASPCTARAAMVQAHRIQVVDFCTSVVTGRRRYDISDAIQQPGWLTTKLIAYHTACSVQTAMVTGRPRVTSRNAGT